MTTTRSAHASVLTGPREHRVVEIEFDGPGPGEVVVAIGSTGVCHTDLHIANSPDGWGRGFPLLLGHEGAGVVEEVGPGVEHVRLGQRVAIGCRAPCGSCSQCRDGRPRRCRASGPRPASLKIAGGPPVTPALGVGLFATRIPVDARIVVPLPDAVPISVAGILGCAVSTGVGAVLNTASLRPGATAAVVGCGGIGLSVLQGTRIAHANPRIAIDIEPRKLVWAQELGATHLVDASREDPVAAVRRITGGEGVSAAFEAVGSARCVEDCVRMLAYGGVAVEIGVPQGVAAAAIELVGPEGLFARTGTLTVTHGGDTIPAQDLPVFARLYLDGALDLDRMVTHEVDLGEIEQGFRNLEDGSSIRTVVRFDATA